MENYASSFGWQWQHFRRTQLDSASGLSISAERFWRQSGWQAAELAGRRVLDVGCGAGRFAEVALASGATVVALDYSLAVDACRQNLGPHPRLEVVQGDIYALPLRPAAFDAVYCFGVLQHTPDVAQAFLALPDMVRPGGCLAVDVYARRLVDLVQPKYWLRQVSCHMPPASLFPLVYALCRLLLPVSTRTGQLPAIGHALRSLWPIANYTGVYSLTATQLMEWSVLDTFDRLAPQYDQPQTVQQVRRWFELAGLDQIAVFRDGLVVGRGCKPGVI
ncbi:MAG: class I SAM-dependent methyltransferase [Chloroflexaceae bacterium]|nr:class I SAM-dependent methyltransferase [Chloroflexaceae bacterium]